MDEMADEFTHLRVGSGDDLYFRAEGFGPRTHLFFYDVPANRSIGTENLGAAIEGMSEMKTGEINRTLSMEMEGRVQCAPNYLYFKNGSISPYTYPEVHLWKPENRTYSFTEVERMDDSNQKMLLDRGENLTIDSRLMDMVDEDEMMYDVPMTFVYQD